MEMNEAIAVIGMDLRFPGDASTPEGFYEMLQTGHSALSDIPSDRYNLDAFYHPDQERAGAVSRQPSSQVCRRTHWLFYSLMLNKPILPNTILRRSMLPFSLSRPLKRRAWIRSNEGCWSPFIVHWKTVSGSLSLGGGHQLR